MSSKPSLSDIGFDDKSLDTDAFADRIMRCTWKYGIAAVRELLPESVMKPFNICGYQDVAARLQAIRAQPIEYHHCKLCNASFSSVARLIRHTQENVCNKPCCRYCEMVFPSKNRLHQHLREECQKRVRSSSKSSSRPSSKSSPQSSSTYLTINDLFRMFSGRSTTTASTTITITIDDPFIRQFVSLLPREATAESSPMASKQPRKSMGLHLHMHGNGIKSWDQAPAATKFCGRIVFLPAQQIPTVSAADLAQHQQQASYARFG